MVCGASGQQVGGTTTTPVGFGGERLHPGMNLIGLMMHKGIIGTGIVASVKGKELLPDEEGAGVLAKLGERKTYILEITSGTQEGAIQEITRWEKGRLFTPDDLEKAGVKAEDTWALRKAATLNTAFGSSLARLATDDFGDRRRFRARSVRDVLRGVQAARLA